MITIKKAPLGAFLMQTIAWLTNRFMGLAFIF